MHDPSSSSSSSTSSSWPWATPHRDEKQPGTTPLSIPWRQLLQWSTSASTGSETWKAVLAQVEHAFKIMSASDIQKLSQLVKGHQWITNVTCDCNDRYGAIFDDFKKRLAAIGFQVTPVAQKIQKDVNRTYGLFCRNSQVASFLFGLKRAAYLKSLHVLLLAAAEQFGYCQGMNFIAANFLLHYSERDAFILFCFLMNERNMRALFVPQSSCLVDFIRVFDKRLKLLYRKVYEHLKAINFSSFCHAIEWFTTCFLVSNPGELSSCVFDMVLLDVNDALIRIGLSVLANLETKLLSMDLEEMQLCFKSLVMELRAADVISVALFIETKGTSSTLGKLISGDFSKKSSPNTSASPWSRRVMESRWEPDSESDDCNDDNNSYDEYMTSAFQTNMSLTGQEQQSVVAYDADNEDERDDGQIIRGNNFEKRKRSPSFYTKIRNRNEAKLRLSDDDLLAKECLCTLGEIVCLWTPYGRLDDIRIPCRHLRSRRGRKINETSARVLRFDPRSRPDGYSRKASCFSRAIEVYLNIPADLGLRKNWLPQVFDDWFVVSVDVCLPSYVNVMFSSYLNTGRALKEGADDTSTQLYSSKECRLQGEKLEDYFTDIEPICAINSILAIDKRLCNQSRQLGTVNRKLEFAVSGKKKKKTLPRRPIKFSKL